MKYGATEYAYAEPFAEALLSDSKFRAWILNKTKFAPFSATARVLSEEMLAARGKSAESWWRSHYTEKCRCEGCSGQETDILAIFESGDARFALHIEVKQPTDRFPANKDQSTNYGIRATCWIENPPTAILRHGDAATVLVCSAFKLKEYAAHPSRFDAVVTFESLRLDFPDATKAL